jgi:hypothetical protein
MHTEKEVRDFLRVADVLFARLNTGKRLSKGETLLLQSYALRVHSLVSILSGYDRLEAARKITTDLCKWEDTLDSTMPSDPANETAAVIPSHTLPADITDL